MELYAVMDYKRFFGSKLPEDPFVSIRTYPTDIVVMFLSKINALIFLHPNSTREADKSVFRQCFPALNQNWLNHLRAETSSVVFFTAQSSLYLLGEMFKAYEPMPEPDDRPVADAQLQLDFFKAVLAANEIYYNQTDANGKQTTLPEIWRLELLQQTYLRKFPDLLGIIPFKGMLFFQFIDHQYGESYTRAFAESFGVPSHFNYMIDLMYIVSGAIREFELTGQLKWVVVLAPEQKKFYAPFIFDPAALKDKTIHGNTFNIVAKPFYPLADAYGIIDYSFFNNLVDIGLFYNMYQHTPLKQRPELKNYNAFQSAVGKLFYEEYFVLRLFQKIFRHRRDEVRAGDSEKGDSDVILIQDERHVFVMEIKSIRVHANVLDALDINGFEDFLTENFANEKENPGEKNKGVFQLARQITAMQEGGSNKTIYPIIIYTDPVMDISGVNNYLIHKSRHRFERFSKSFKKVYPVTCINLDFFILFYPELKKDRHFLKDVIISYHDRIKSNQKSFLRSGNPSTYLKANYSFMRVMDEKASTTHEFFRMISTDFGFR